MQTPEILLLKSQQPELHPTQRWLAGIKLRGSVGNGLPSSPVSTRPYWPPAGEPHLLTFLTLEFVTPGLVVESFGDRWMEACHGSPCPGSHFVLLIIVNVCDQVGKTGNTLPGPKCPPWQVQKPIQIVFLFSLLI